MAITLPPFSTNSNIIIIGGVIGGLATLTILTLYPVPSTRYDGGSLYSEWRRFVNRGSPFDERIAIVSMDWEVMEIGALPDEPSPDPPPYTSQEGRASCARLPNRVMRKMDRTDILMLWHDCVFQSRSWRGTILMWVILLFVAWQLQILLLRPCTEFEKKNFQ